jgi:ADP-ribosyl-[dinitrogen reductase] hydrolase
MRITQDHIKSIIFGVAVGDALGVPVEFSSRERMVDNPSNRHDWFWDL